MKKTVASFMKNHIANIITGSRVIFSLPLLFVPLSSIWFCILYLFCGLTDMIDGTIARKTGADNKFGAKMDTASDFVFLFVCSIKVLPLVRLPVWLWVWIISVSLIKIFNIVFVLIRKKKLISIHSVFNKITGFSMFLLPPMLIFFPSTYIVTAICVLATFAIMQEVYLVAKEQEIL